MLTDLNPLLMLISATNKTCTSADMGCSCYSCGEAMPEMDCDNSDNPCGHHCNHSWTHDSCCWCGVEFNEDGDEII